MRELYLCLDQDATGEGQKATRELSRQVVLWGLSVHTMVDGALRWPLRVELGYARSARLPSTTTLWPAPSTAKPTDLVWRSLPPQGHKRRHQGLDWLVFRFAPFLRGGPRLRYLSSHALQVQAGGCWWYQLILDIGLPIPLPCRSNAGVTHG